MHVLVTRPADLATAWTQPLSGAGLPALSLPLLEIGGAAPSQMQKAWARVEQGHYDAVLLVSPNAVRYFFAARPIKSAESVSPTVPRFFVVGPSSRAALLACGVASEQIDAPSETSAQLDSEALWQVVAPRIGPGFRLLLVRGTDEQVPDGLGSDAGVGREWFAQQVLQAGGKVDYVVAYHRGAPRWSQEQVALARRALHDQSVWLFSNSEAIQHLASLLKGETFTQARCVATHPRIAQAARQVGFGVVCESRPTPDALIASIKSLA